MSAHQTIRFPINLRKGFPRFILAAAFLLFSPRLVLAFCHETEVAANWPLKIIPAAVRSGTLTMEWLGHSAFYLTSSRGTKVLMDPYGGGFPLKEIFPHIVTTSHFAGNHSGLEMANGNPIVLHGINMQNGDWVRIHKTIRDVSIFTVPTFHDGHMGMVRGKITVFVVRMDGICVAHLEDLGHLLDETQIKMMGKIDILLVPLGQGGYRITTEDAIQLVQQVKPKVAIPYHYRWEEYADQFAGSFLRVRKIEGSQVNFSKGTFNSNLEIVVLRDIWENSQ